MLPIIALVANALPSLTGCAAVEERIARSAKTDLVGMSALDVQTCLGLPDQRLVDGKTTLLTYFANANRTFGLSVGVTSFSMSGYCHAIVRIDDDRMTRVAFSGDTGVLLSHDAACAPIVQTCLSTEFRGNVQKTSLAPRHGRNREIQL